MAADRGHGGLRRSSGRCSPRWSASRSWPRSPRLLYTDARIRKEGFDLALVRAVPADPRRPGDARSPRQWPGWRLDPGNAEARTGCAPSWPRRPTATPVTRSQRERLDAIADWLCRAALRRRRAHPGVADVRGRHCGGRGRRAGGLPAALRAPRRASAAVPTRAARWVASGSPQRSAARRSAAFAEGPYAACSDAMRAIAPGAAERTLLEDSPSLTAHEIADRLAEPSRRRRPSCAGRRTFSTPWPTAAAPRAETRPSASSPSRAPCAAPGPRLGAPGRRRTRTATGRRGQHARRRGCRRRGWRTGRGTQRRWHTVTLNVWDRPEAEPGRDPGTSPDGADRAPAPVQGRAGGASSW